jgi:CheY-like chemotaxis protein
VPIEVFVGFAGLRGAHRARVERTLSQLPGLCGGALLHCDLAVRPATGATIALLRLADGHGAALARVRFWFAREEGYAVPLATLPAAEANGLVRSFDRCELKIRNVAPAALADAARSLLGPEGEEPSPTPGWPPALALDVLGPGWEGIEYDPSRARLFVPSPLAPLVGDPLLLELRVPATGEVVRAPGRIAEVRDAEAAAPGRPAGFFVALSKDADHARLVLSTHAEPPAGFAQGRRASPRYRVAGVARCRPVRDGVAAGDACEATIENVSRDGAFLRTGAPPPNGTSLELAIRFGGETEVVARGTVIHSGPRGVGVRFDPDPVLAAALASLLARLPGRPRRVLVVEDDPFARRMLAEAFEASGLDVVTASDGLSALHVLVDELQGLDLLVTDVVLEDVDGEELIRRIRGDGGDLPILVVTANATPELKAHLAEAGADEVVAKALGSRSVVQSALAVLERRRGNRAGG